MTCGVTDRRGSLTTSGIGAAETPSVPGIMELVRVENHSGEVLALANSDDEPCKQWLSRMAAAYLEFYGGRTALPWRMLGEALNAPRDRLRMSNVSSAVPRRRSAVIGAGCSRKRELQCRSKETANRGRLLTCGLDLTAAHQLQDRIDCCRPLETDVWNLRLQPITASAVPERQPRSGCCSAL